MINFKKITLLIFCFYFYKNVCAQEISRANSKSEKIKKDWPTLWCDESYGWINPEDQILIFKIKHDDKAVNTNRPYIKLYNSKKFEGKPSAEINKDGLFIKGEKKCIWYNEINSWVKSDEERFYRIFLSTLENGKATGNLCHELNMGDHGFRINEVGEDYYLLNVENEKYYISKNEAKEYEYQKSRNQISEVLRNKLYDRFNENFVENQKTFINYMDKAKRCFETKNMKKDCDILPKIDNRLVKYMCYSKLVDCPAKISKWMTNKKIEEIYWKNLEKCFDYKSMKVVLSEMQNKETPWPMSFGDKKVDIFKTFVNLDKLGKNLYCTYKVEFGKDKIDKIEMSIYVDVSFPEDEEVSEDAPLVDKDTPRYDYFFNVPIRGVNRPDDCNNEVHPLNIISISEIGDKNAKKLGK